MQDIHFFQQFHYDWKGSKYILPDKQEYWTVSYFWKEVNIIFSDGSLYEEWIKYILEFYTI